MINVDKQICQEIKDHDIIHINHSLYSIHMMYKGSTYYALRKASILKHELFLEICKILKINKVFKWLNSTVRHR